LIAGVGSTGAVWQYCHSVERADGPAWQWQYCHNAHRTPLLLSPSGLRRLMAWFRGVGLGWRAGLAHRGARGRLRDTRRLSLPALLRRDARHWLIQQVLELHVGRARTQTRRTARERVLRGHVAGN